MPFTMHDAEYYSNPQQFNPNRFTAEAIKRPALCFLPFGLGPRNCIGIHNIIISYTFTQIYDYLCTF